MNKLCPQQSLGLQKLQRCFKILEAWGHELKPRMVSKLSELIQARMSTMDAAELKGSLHLLMRSGQGIVQPVLVGVYAHALILTRVCLLHGARLLLCIASLLATCYLLNSAVTVTSRVNIRQ